jgi:hypothetical protein
MQILKKCAAGVMLLSAIVAMPTMIVPPFAHGEDIKLVTVVNTPLPVTDAKLRRTDSRPFS